MSHLLKKMSIAVIGACALMAHADTKLGPYAPVTDALFATRATKLVDVPWQLQRLGLQPTGQDQRR